MPVEVTVEDGTGLADANSYGSVADADGYFATRPRSSAWTPLSVDLRGQYLIHAARIMDASMTWLGEKLKATQSLAFPRWPIDDLDAAVVPRDVIRAQFELAYSLIGTDLTGEPGTTGFQKIVVGPIELTAAPGERPATIPRFVQDLLSKYGTARASSSNARLIRR